MHIDFTSLVDIDSGRLTTHRLFIPDLFFRLSTPSCSHAVSLRADCKVVCDSSRSSPKKLPFARPYLGRQVPCVASSDCIFGRAEDIVEDRVEDRYSLLATSIASNV